jgi:hypothetical protein
MSGVNFFTISIASVNNHITSKPLADPKLFFFTSIISCQSTLAFFMLKIPQREIRLGEKSDKDSVSNQIFIVSGVLIFSPSCMQT